MSVYIQLRPEYLWWEGGELNNFKENIKMYVNNAYKKKGKEYVKKDKKKYELLKLKTECKWPKTISLIQNFSKITQLPIDNGLGQAY